MVEWRILNEREKSEIEKSLDIEFGINEIPGKLFTVGGEKLFLFDGEASEEEIEDIVKLVPIERIGVYFARVVAGEIRLSIEGTQILRNQIKKNIFELDDEQAESWMRGEELNIKMENRGFLVMKYKDNLLGCGKASLEKIGNFIPKNRRLKRKNN